MNYRTHNEIIQDLWAALEQSRIKKSDFAKAIGLHVSSVREIRIKEDMTFARFWKAVQVLELDPVKLIIGREIISDDESSRLLIEKAKIIALQDDVISLLKSENRKK